PDRVMGHEVRPVPIRVEGGTRFIDHDPAAHELHVAPDRLPQHAEYVRAGGGAVAGSELLRVARAPEDVPALEDQRLHAGARQIETGDEAVVASADNDGVVAPASPR